MKLKKLKREAEDFLSFPILAALSRRSMTERELGHTMLLSRCAIRNRLKALKEAGYIIKGEGGKWTMIVRLGALTIPEATGVPGVTPTPDEVAHGPAAGVPILEAVKAPQSPPPVPTLKEVVDTPPVATQTTLEGNMRVAAHFNVPVFLSDEGSVAVGKMCQCKLCGGKTPLKYGSSAICVRCARVWGRVTG